MTQTRRQHNTESSQRQDATTSELVEREQVRADEPPLKKPRSEEHERSTHTHTEASLSPFQNLPLELLGEILILTESPKHVLAVARSSKFLCTILLDPSSAYIWRAARKICKPKALPEPFPIFTEASYAAFVFDGGRCEASGCTY